MFGSELLLKNEEGISDAVFEPVNNKEGRDVPFEMNAEIEGDEVEKDEGEGGEISHK